MILADFRDGHAGADAGWRRNRRRHLVRGFGAYAQIPEVAGAAVAVAEEEFMHPKHRTAILVGITTGVGVWAITRILGAIFSSRKS